MTLQYGNSIEGYGYVQVQVGPRRGIRIITRHGDRRRITSAALAEAARKIVHGETVPNLRTTAGDEIPIWQILLAQSEIEILTGGVKQAGKPSVSIPVG